MKHLSAALLRRLHPFCARALEAAASLCQTRAHKDITPEHWLLKLFKQGEGDIMIIARRYEWDRDGIWRDLLAFLDCLPRTVHARPQLPGSLETLLQQAWLEESVPQIRSIHLLKALSETPSLVRCNVLWLLHQPAGAVTAVTGYPVGRGPVTVTQVVTLISGMQENREPPVYAAELTAKALTCFTRDITADARKGKIDPVFGRDNEIRQMVDILSRRRKNNPILVGEPGVGTRGWHCALPQVRCRIA